MNENNYRQLLRKQVDELMDLSEVLYGRVEQLKSYILRAGYEVPPLEAGLSAPVVALEREEVSLPRKRQRVGNEGSYVSAPRTEESIPWDMLENSIVNTIRSAIADGPSFAEQSHEELETGAIEAAEYGRVPSMVLSPSKSEIYRADKNAEVPREEQATAQAAAIGEERYSDQGVDTLTLARRDSGDSRSSRRSTLRGSRSESGSKRSSSTDAANETSKEKVPRTPHASNTSRISTLRTTPSRSINRGSTSRTGSVRKSPTPDRSLRKSTSDNWALSESTGLYDGNRSIAGNTSLQELSLQNAYNGAYDPEIEQEEEGISESQHLVHEPSQSHIGHDTSELRQQQVATVGAESEPEDQHMLPNRGDASNYGEVQYNEDLASNKQETADIGHSSEESVSQEEFPGFTESTGNTSTYGESVTHTEKEDESGYAVETESLQVTEASQPEEQQHLNESLENSRQLDNQSHTDESNNSSYARPVTSRVSVSRVATLSDSQTPEEPSESNLRDISNSSIQQQQREEGASQEAARGEHNISKVSSATTGKGKGPERPLLYGNYNNNTDRLDRRASLPAQSSSVPLESTASKAKQRPSRYSESNAYDPMPPIPSSILKVFDKIQSGHMALGTTTAQSPQASANSPASSHDGSKGRTGRYVPRMYEQTPAKAQAAGSNDKVQRNTSSPRVQRQQVPRGETSQQHHTPERRDGDSRKASGPLVTSTPAPSMRVQSQSRDSISDASSSGYVSALSMLGPNEQDSSNTTTTPRSVSFRLPANANRSVGSNTSTDTVTPSTVHQSRLPRLPSGPKLPGAWPSDSSPSNSSLLQNQQKRSLPMRRRLNSRNVYEVDDSQASLPDMSEMQVNPGDISEVRGRPRSLGP